MGRDLAGYWRDTPPLFPSENLTALAKIPGHDFQCLITESRAPLCS
jgi:hypothetical protein